MTPMDLQELTIEGRSAVALSGELNINTAPDLRDVLMNYLKKREPTLMLDLSGLEFMDTSGLATLIEANLKAQDYGGKLVLFGLNEQIAEVFEVTHVVRIFSVFGTRQEALDALEEPAG